MDEGDRSGGDDAPAEEATRFDDGGGDDDRADDYLERDNHLEREQHGDTNRNVANRAEREDGSNPAESFLYRFRHDETGALMWIREMLSSVTVVLVLGLVLFGVSGVWPPMVAVESGSMEPNMQVGDLVFVTEPGRLAPDAADNGIGVVTYAVGEETDYRTFGSYGSVVIYRPPGRTAAPIIHRAMFHVEEDENWYDRADERYHDAENCVDLRYCPAPHDGFITLGDNNGEYDQANGLAAPVKAEWVTGVARVRIPYLGYVRLIATGQAEPSDVFATATIPSIATVDVADVESDRSGVESIPLVSGGAPIPGGDDVDVGGADSGESGKFDSWGRYEADTSEDGSSDGSSRNLGWATVAAG
ncbi:S26 family signal peptidase [Halorubrum sp. CBA1125]|uniref:S26 family signal peptidase n=1 Tax=Halorubrum sp. CBA1125 TaxID=2668072 RepID=UPI001E2E4F1E|nr:S26 family signal peptidase [Halorubrum sp. CBA1125]